jgi:NADH:ubiquinone oxidoreductase subunit 2 (subunit N)
MAILAAIGKPFIPTWAAGAGYQLQPFSAELILIGTMIAVLLCPFFTRRSNTISAAISLGGLVLALVSLVWSHAELAIGQQFVGMLLSDNFAVFWKVLLLVFTIGVMLMWWCVASPLRPTC